MGKEHSKLDAFPDLEDEAIEVSECYVLRTGVMPNGSACSVFSGIPTAPLLDLSANLKTHRHPNIVKYLSSGYHGENFYVATEPVQPLVLVLKQLDILQICVGLDGVISALSFLHEKAAASHNNVCCSSIFVSNDGNWKLGGFEFMCKLENLHSETLSSKGSRRYEPAMAPEEESGRIDGRQLDVYALGILITELLEDTIDDHFAGLQDFLSLCKTRMLEKTPALRCSLSEVAAHSFFKQNFIHIYKFLTELPLKTADDKSQFFSELETSLPLLPEEMVASQLMPLLLSRVVVLEPTAQNLLPRLLTPRMDSQQDKTGFFSETTFKQFITPRLLQMFRVRDTSIRLLLLRNLPAFLLCFSKEEMQSQLLPELLVGVKDENDELVEETLRGLASLVRILGGSAVVGKNRARIFSDGRPASRKARSATAASQLDNAPTRDAVLPERPSPDGGEDSVAEDTEAWSDWEQTSDKIEAETKHMDRKLSETSESAIAKGRERVNMLDIESLDIKTGVGWCRESGPDFFTDMEPVISRPQLQLVKPETSEQDKFRVAAVPEAESAEAWDSFDDWGEG